MVAPIRTFNSLGADSVDVLFGGAITASMVIGAAKDVKVASDASVHIALMTSN